MRNFLRLHVALCVWILAVWVVRAQDNYEPTVDPRIIQLLEVQYPELFYPDFDLVKRYNAYGFGHGKRKPFSFGLGKRAKQFNFGLGKRREQYAFGLGKRNADDKDLHSPSEVHNERTKRSIPQWESYNPTLEYSAADKRAKSYSFGLGKRNRAYSFGLGKRWPMDYPAEEHDLEELYDNFVYHPLLDLPQRVNLDSKRAKNPYSFGLGKRSYSFGLGKRAGYSFGLGKREELLDNIDPYEPDKRAAYKFGLGKRAYSFGLGKRSTSEEPATIESE